MYLKRWIQYRLATLLLAVTFSAVALFAWMRIVTPNVTGFHVEGGQLVLHLSDKLGRKMLPDDPYFDAVVSDPNVYMHDTYISFPLHVVAIVMTVILGVIGGIYFGLRWLVGRPTTHGRRAESPSA